MSDVYSLIELSMSNHMQRMNVISNNLANVSTPGFKRDIAVMRNDVPSFESQLDSVASSGLQNGSAHVRTTIDPQTGAIKFSGNPLDVAIESEGFFELQRDGATFFTRQGTLSLDSEGRLVLGNAVVQGVGGEIRLSSEEPRIDKQGRVWEDQRVVGQLKLVDISNPQDLQRRGNGLYTSTATQNNVLPEEKIRVRQGYVEASNVNMMQEMVNMIELMRQFEANQKLITNYDGLIDSAINTLGEY